MVVIGVDAHKRTHTLVAVDELGRTLGERTVATTTERHPARGAMGQPMAPGALCGAGLPASDPPVGRRRAAGVVIPWCGCLPG